jgi:hypothetical protein
MSHIKGRCEPAYTIVRRFGGVTPTAKILSIGPSSVSRWLVPEGTGGVIPQSHWVKLLNHAIKRNISLSLKDLSGIVIE